AAAQTKSPGLGDVVDGAKLRPIPQGSTCNLWESTGEPQSVTLPANDKIEPGEQNLLYWAREGEGLVKDQLLLVRNQARTFRRWFIVHEIHGGRGTGLRKLDLRDAFEPYFAEDRDLTIEATGQYRVQDLGPADGYGVVAPNGSIRMKNFRTQKE